ncbi:MAG TPA: 2-C-methyl-D-erythritol 4-phosphate cytidylyltransferase [Eubacterium sp.]|nr:2-C-methyl-D-erythritol 4-phosphate cytidylyltransferase [Eubacterium sp.]
MNYALLLSGGTGTRANSDVPKQYVRSGDLMMITYALKTLLDCEKIDSVCIVAEREWHESIVDDAKNAGCDIGRISGFAMPGSSRQMSILNGMREIMCHAGGDTVASGISSEDTILIHDAARAFVSLELIDRCYEALDGYDGVMPVLPMKDTVYLSEDGKSVAGLVDREKIYAGQAPELFRFTPYYDANASLTEDALGRIKGASEIAYAHGMNIRMVQGDENNFKVTTALDLERFRRIKEEA